MNSSKKKAGLSDPPSAYFEQFADTMLDKAKREPKSVAFNATRLFRKNTYWAVAASILALVAVGLVVFNGPSPSDLHGNVVVEQLAADLNQDLLTEYLLEDPSISIEQIIATASETGLDLSEETTAEAYGDLVDMDELSDYL